MVVLGSWFYFFVALPSLSFEHLLLVSESFLKTSVIQSPSADKSLVVWTLQNSSTWGGNLSFVELFSEETFVR